MPNTGSRHLTDQLFTGADEVGDIFDLFVALISPLLLVGVEERGPIDNVGQLVEAVLDLFVVLLDFRHSS